MEKPIKTELGNTKIRKNFFMSILLPTVILSAIIFGTFYLITNSLKGSENINTKDKKEIKKELKEISEKTKEKFIEISKLNLAESPLKIYGKTTSLSESSVFAQIPAEVKRVYVKLGDYVSAGEVVVMLDSENEQNHLLQANLSLNSAELALTKTLSGAREEDKEIAKLDLKIKKSTLAKTNSDIAKQISDLKIFLEKTLRQDIDDFFDHTEFDNDAYKTDPVFTYRLKSQITISKLEEDRKSLGLDLKKFLENEKNYSPTEKIQKSVEISESFSELANLLYTNSKDFLGFSERETETFEAKTLATKKQIDAQKEITKNLQNIFDQQNSAAKIAENNLSKINAGARNEDIDLSKSQIEIAENSVAAAQIALDKKVLRAPISGKISEISADVGKLATSAVPIFSITNPLNLKVESAIDSENKKYIFVGKEILVNSKKAKISAISPVINSESGAVDFEAIFTEKISDLKSGEIVDIIISKKAKKEKSEKSNISLPLSAVFEKDQKYFVFLLGSDLKAKEKEIEFIKISGENILVKNNFQKDQKLIINARGISGGDEL